MIGVATSGNVAKRHRVVGGSLQFAAGEYASRITVNQNRQQGRWVVCPRATPCVLARQIGEIKSINDFNDEASQVVLCEPLIYRRGQQEVGFAVGEDEVGHGQN